MLKLIGDVHGKHNSYYKICKESEKIGIPTLQLGDLGFNYDILKLLDPYKHKFIGGNHDNYELVNNYDHYLGDYGSYTFGGVTFFFVRGAFSLDYRLRRLGIDLFEQEQLSYLKGCYSLQEYEKVKPEIVISHDCPNVMRDYFCENGYGLFGNKKIHTFTGTLLQQMFEIHPPKFWYFGHWHTNITKVIDNCQFKCLAELSICVI